MIDWYNYSWVETIEKLDSNEKTGLDSNKVKELQEKYGNNRIFQLGQVKHFPIVKKMLLSTWVILLILSSVLMLFSKNYILGILIFVFTAASDFLYHYDELVKIKNIKQLERIDDIYASVSRDGRIFKIPAEQLVVGDIVFVEKGVSVPADLRIFESKNLNVKQTSVTGENYEVEKYETMIEEHDVSLTEMKNMLFKSSIVVEGIGAGVVTAIGRDTEVGKIISSIQDNDSRSENFYSLVKTSIKILDIVAIISVLMTIPINFFYGISLEKIAAKASLVLSCFLPIMLITIIGVYFQLIKRFYKHNGIEIKNFSSIEVASKIDMIFVQKIGFFSENKMEAVKIYSDETITDLSLQRFEITKNIERIIHIALLCNNNSKNNVEEKALIEFGKKYSYDKYFLESKYRRMFEVPFDVDRGIKTTVNKIDKKYRANVVGAVDKLLEKCKFIMKEGLEVEITNEDIEKIKLADIDMSAECLNVTGFAYRNFKYSPSKDENIESYLVFVGLIGFINPLKEEVVESLQLAKDYGIKTIITSEDSKLTSISVGNNMGFKIEPENVLCGIEIENMDEESLNNFINNVKLLSRLAIKDKLRVIKTFKNVGHNILVTGINLTDLPLLKAGDLRVAFSNTCSSTLKSTSDAYIADESFTKLLFFINESRRVYNKFLRILKYSFAVSISGGVYILLYCCIKNLNLANAFTTQQSNFVFAILSIIYFSLRNKTYDINKMNNRINYRNIMIISALTGMLSFIVSALGSSWNSSVGIILAIVLLPLAELIFLNRKFYLW